MTPLYIWAKLLKKIRGSALINSSIHKTSKVEAGSQIVNSTMDKYSYCGYDCTIVNCCIGAFCSIAGNVYIGGAMHPVEWVSTSPAFYSGRDSIKKKFAEHNFKNSIKTYIENDVWIGEKVLIKQGVKIGNGAIIGMGSVVTKDVAPYSIVAGCPAKVIRMRFDKHIIEKLESFKWWTFSDAKLQKYAQFINNPINFINEVERDLDQGKGV